MTDIIRTMERMLNIINELRDLNSEMNKLLINSVEEPDYIWDFDDDLDSFENLTDEELEGLINEEYKDNGGN